MNLDQKAQEISFILIKISVYIRRKELRERIERLAFDLLEAIFTRDLRQSLAITSAIDGFVRFGGSVYEIEPVNADFIVDLVSGINAAIRQSTDEALPDIEKSPDIRNIASRAKNIFQNQKVPTISKKIASDDSSFGLPNNNAAIESGNALDNPAIRQSAIFQRVKERPDKPIQLKDISGFFPGVSERTLRYDLQRLSAEGKIERIGQGGPATYYRIRVV